MRLFVDCASPSQIEDWVRHPWVSGFTTNPTLMRKQGGAGDNAILWAKEAVKAARGKPISIDGPESVTALGENVYRKVIDYQGDLRRQLNHTAICTSEQLRDLTINLDNIISVFAGRIMDTGRDPQPVIDAAKATGAQVLWASVREPYNIVQAEKAGCDIVTVSPAILQKYLDWNGKPLEVVAKETIAQFAKDSEDLQW